MFNIRVYGILLNDQKQILVSDEFIKGNFYTKFCGGGLELGEGTIDCLKREFIEEMNLRIDIIRHLYTTDFYQDSAFNKAHQIISIYYLVEPLEEITAPLRTTPFYFDQAQQDIHKVKGQSESFRFINWHEFSAACMTLPIDKIVADLIKNELAQEGK